MRQPDDPAKPIGPPWLAEVARDVTALGGVAVLTLIAIAVLGFLWLRRMYGAMWLVVAATLGGLIVSTVLKQWFERPRPDIVPHLSPTYTSSFPSGHSLLSATVFLTLGRAAGPVCSRVPVEGVLPDRRSHPDVSGRSQPRLPGRTLADRRAGRLVRGPRLGDALLARRTVLAASRDGGTKRRCARPTQHRPTMCRITYCTRLAWGIVLPEQGSLSRADAEVVTFGTVTAWIAILPRTHQTGRIPIPIRKRLYDARWARPRLPLPDVLQHIIFARTPSFFCESLATG